MKNREKNIVNVFMLDLVIYRKSSVECMKRHQEHENTYEILKITCMYIIKTI